MNCCWHTFFFNTTRGTLGHESLLYCRMWGAGMRPASPALIEFVWMKPIKLGLHSYITINQKKCWLVVMYECRGFFSLKNPSSLRWPQSFWFLSDCSELELRCHSHHTLSFLLRLCALQQTSLELLLSYLLVLGFDNKTPWFFGLWLTWRVKISMAKAEKPLSLKQASRLEGEPLMCWALTEETSTLPTAVHCCACDVVRQLEMAQH